MRSTKNQTKYWSRLDNAAKIFPCTSNKRDTKVFRFTCELYEPVEEKLLQQSLNITIKDFPIYSCVLKKGLFWYYLENSNIEPVVIKEYKQPCSPLYIHNKKSLLFEVSYYKNRINLEVYHAISDGTGAMHFLRAMVFNYLKLKYPKKLEAVSALSDFDASFSERMDDSFKKYYSSQNNKKEKTKRIIAYRVRSPRLSENRISIIEGIVPLDRMLKLAHEYNTSLTVLIAAMFLMSINDVRAVRDMDKPIVLVVPVNLRKYFASESIRNFFGLINVGYDFKEDTPKLSDVIKSVHDCFKRELTADQLSAKMNSLSAIENNIFARPVPLGLKDFIMKIANRLAEQERTASLSNIGSVSMPEEAKEYIRLFDVFVSTNIIQICMCSFENNITISFSSAYVDTDIQKNFFRRISAHDIPIEITANQQ